MIKKTDVESHIAFIRIPKPLIHDGKYKQLSLAAKFMYGLLYDRLQLSLKNKWYDPDGLVCQYYTNEQFMIDLSASEKTVIKIKKELSSIGLLKEVRQGVNLPNRLYLSVVTGTVKSTGQELENLQGNKTEKSKTEKSNNKLSICQEVISYLNLKANKHFKLNTASHQKFIKARINEGYTIDDFKKVIDVMTAKWLGTDFEQYLQPQTLFGNKMDNYLNTAIPKRQQLLASATDERLGF
ncbi:hypothetical protein DIY18_09210 [Streptococcus iniae]|uniref:conserved phage C-terminal domain-containing protein n=1 Tax=Streptococcus iniae TaxID=1346 RepID=UPI000EF8097C|nr:conserved phage C-terminal domain-containing protein [Streptococcus iniae]RLU42617.1 hypothetical protein DIY18_09210 [Streptococcus iniae]